MLLHRKCVKPAALNCKSALAIFRAIPTGPGQLPSLLRVEDERRNVLSAFVQNQIELNDALQLTLGLRYDDNQDVGERLTPRASLVWRPAERHVLKAQYAQGYRAPTFFELYGGGDSNGGLDFEVNTTTEFSYIYRQPGRTLRATLFRARLDDMVFVLQGRPGFGNVVNARADGVELEWDQRLRDGLDLKVALSHTDAQDRRNRTRQLATIAGTPKWLGHAGLVWKTSDRHSYGLTWNHVGERRSATIGNGRYDRIDLSSRLAGLWHPNLDLRLGVDNVLNERTVQIVTAPNGVTTLPYQDRIYWVELRWRM